MKPLSIAFATILASATASVATASTPAEPGPQRVVRFADLDLTNPSDVAKLHQRSWAAARDGCRTARVLSLYDGSYLQQCTRYSARHALANVDASAGTRVAGEIK